MKKQNRDIKDNKKCSRCGKIKPLTEYYKRSANKDGLSNYCIECDKEYKKLSRRGKITKGRKSNALKYIEREVEIKEVKLLREVDKLVLNNQPRRALVKANMLQGRSSGRELYELEEMCRVIRKIIERKDLEYQLRGDEDIV